MRGWIKYITLLVVFSAYSNAGNQDILWSGSASVSWEAYQQIETTTEHYDAVTATAIDFSYTQMESQILIEIQAIFDTQESWVKASAKTDQLLNHERLHFDITEVYARKLRFMIQNNELNSVNDLNTYYDVVMRDLIFAQEEYDMVSHHALNRDGQSEWNIKVANLLQLYEGYENTSFIIPTPSVATD